MIFHIFFIFCLAPLIYSSDSSTQTVDLDNQLIEASDNGDLQTLYQVIQQGANVNALSSYFLPLTV